MHLAMLARKTKTFWISISDASQLHKPQHKANLGQALGQKEFAPLLNQKNRHSSPAKITPGESLGQYTGSGTYDFNKPVADTV